MKVEIDVDKFLADNCDEAFYEHASSVTFALLKHFENPSDELLRKIISAHPERIESVENPSKELILLAFNTEPYTIFRNLQLFHSLPLKDREAFYGRLMRYGGHEMSRLEDLPDSIVDELLSRRPEDIYYFLDRSEKYQLRGVKQDRDNLRFIHKPFPAVVEYVNKFPRWLGNLWEDSHES